MCAFLYMSVSDYLFVDTHMVSLFFPPILQPVSFRKVTFPLIPNLIVFGSRMSVLKYALCLCLNQQNLTGLFLFFRGIFSPFTRGLTE